MTISLCTTTDEPNTLTKTYDTIGSVNCSPYESLGELTGRVIITFNDEYFAANYAIYNGRYYFISNREYLPAGKMALTLETDVLMTFHDDIQALPVIAYSSESECNLYIPDGRQRQNAYTRMQTILVGAPFTYPNQILVQTVG